MLKKWYFAMNGNAVGSYAPMMQRAVLSCLKNTSLKPYCLYDGVEHPVLGWMVEHGVTLIRHRVSLYDHIMATPDTTNWKKSIATGAYLRVDIPSIETEEEYILYTDADVLFLRQPRYTGRPKYFAAAPENDPNNWEFVNTGAMVMNVPAMKNEHENFLARSKDRLNAFASKGHGTYDQGSLNAYYAGKWERLPLEMNWKPYWGLNRSADIIHFHGPKPEHIAKIANKNLVTIPEVYVNLYNLSQSGMNYYLGFYDSFSVETSDSGKVVGFVDGINLKKDDLFSIEGWGLTIKGKGVGEFKVTYDGSPVNITSLTRVDRPDVIRRLPEGSLQCGFNILVKLPEKADKSKIELYAGSESVVIPRAKSFITR